jgi:hypothetical protein
MDPMKLVRRKKDLIMELLSDFLLAVIAAVLLEAVKAWYQQVKSRR